MKRLILLVAVGFIVSIGTGVFAASEPPYYLKSGKPFAGQTVSVLIHTADQYYAVRDNHTDEFEKLSGIKVDWVFTPFPSLHEKASTELVGGTGKFDVVNISARWGTELGPWFISLQNLAAEDKFPMDFPAFALDLATVGGELKALPNRGNAQGFWYRNDIFDQLGLLPPETWDEMAEAGKKVQDSTDLDGVALVYARTGPGVTWNINVWGSMVLQKGAEFVDDEWKPAYNNKAGIEGTQRFIDFMLKDQIAAPGSLAYSDYEKFLNFAHGKSAMTIGLPYPWVMFVDPKRSKIVDKFKFTGLLTFERGGTLRAYASSQLFGIPKASPSTGAAWEFLKWFAGPKLEKDGIMAGEHVAAIHLNNLRDPEMNEKYDNMFLGELPGFEGGWNWPKFAEAAEFFDAISLALAEMVTGRPVEEALAEAEQKNLKMLERAGY